MRVSTLILLAAVGGLLVLGVVCHRWVFARVDEFNQWQTGFSPAQTPNEAMEKFREAIYQRRYAWAARYCTPEYADVLIKCNGPANQLGTVIDKIRTYMQNNKLQTDQSLALLMALDPFPANFKVNGAVKTLGDKEAIGFFAWEPMPYNPNSSLNGIIGQIDNGMFQTSLTAEAALFGPRGVHLVKDSDAWKLHVVPTPVDLEKVRYFLDHWKTYETELGTLRTYMTNGRYDSPKSFESEILDSLKKARS